MTESCKRLLFTIFEILFDNFDIVIRSDGGELIIQFRSRPIPDHLSFFDENNKEIDHMDPIAAGKKRVLSFKVETKNNTVITPEIVGVPEWSVLPADSVQLLPAPDGLTCDVANINGVAVDFTVTCKTTVKLANGSTKDLSDDETGSALADVSPDHIEVVAGPEVDL